MNNITPIIFTQSKDGRKGFSTPNNDISGFNINEIIDEKYLRKQKVNLPQVSEPQIARHFVNLSVKNHHVDRNFYPLGSCTMKYNPKINDSIAMLGSFANIHPEQNSDSIQGVLKVCYDLGQYLCEITGRY